MRWQVYLMVFIILLMLCGTAVAQSIPNATISPSESPWVVANGSDFTPISVTVRDSSNNTIANLTVFFSVNDSKFGTVNPISTRTDVNGVASTIFKSKTVSGTVNVTATIHYNDSTGDNTLNKSRLVYIDHDVPYSFKNLSYPKEATVGAVDTITVVCQDIHGNAIDNRRFTESVDFSILTINDSSRLWNSSSLTFSNISSRLPLNENGMTYTNISFSTAPGDTLIRIQPPLKISEITIPINRVANGIPWSIYVRKDPSVNFVPADNESKFVFTVILYDQYGNGLNNKKIELNSSTGDWGPILVTTISGKAAVSYGGYPTPFFADVTAKAFENQTVNDTFHVEFYDPSPKKLLLTISPNSMQSLDSDSNSTAIITAAVVDKYGKPVPNQNVTLTISNIQNGTFLMSSNPSLSPQKLNSVILSTGQDGFGVENFFPGAFIKDVRNLTKKAQCDVVATWKGQTQTVTPVWRNYPYLSMTTTDDHGNRLYQPGEMVNITVRVDADGPGLTSKPIDLLLCADRGTSMLKDMYWQGQSGSFEDKMVYLYGAGASLFKYLNTDSSTEDWAGIVSYGSKGSTTYPKNDPGDDNDRLNTDESYIAANYASIPGYGDYATTDVTMTKLTEDVNASIRNITPYGDKQAKNHVPLRYGLYKSIQELTGHGDSLYRNNTIKAIVLLADSKWDDYGDPTAGGMDGTIDSNQGHYENDVLPTKINEGGQSAYTAFTEFDNDTNVLISDNRQNLVNYAAENGIYIFVVGYFEKGNTINENDKILLKYLASGTGGDYFEADCGENLTSIFDTIGTRLRKEASINTTAVLNLNKIQVGPNLLEGNVAFDYVQINESSTLIKKWNKTIELYNYTRDDSDNWTNTQILEFDLGTMYLGDHWLTNFTLRAKPAVEGYDVEFFGTPGSGVNWDGGNINASGFFRFFIPTHLGDIPTENLTITMFDVSPSMNAKYNINYSGNKTVHVKLYYTKMGDISEKWTQFAVSNLQCVNEACTGSASLNTWLLGTGDYKFKIEAWAPDTPMDTKLDVQSWDAEKTFIRLR